MTSKSECGEQGRGLPVGWGWREQVGARILEGPGHMGALHLARAHFAGDWQAGDEKSIAVPNRGETLLAAAQREAEAALWRVDGFGVGEVRGLRVGLHLDTVTDLIDTRCPVALLSLPGEWCVTRAQPVEGGVEVDAVRAPAEPIRIAVGAPDPLGLGVGEHDAPGGGPCSCGAWHRAPVAEPAPLSKTGPSCKWELCRAPLSSPPRPGCGARHHHDADDAAEPAPREPSAPTDADPPRPLPDRAAWLLHPVSSTGRETIAASQYEELRAEAVALRARVAELEEELADKERHLSTQRERAEDAEEEVAELTATLEATPPPGTVAALLAVVDRITFDAPDDKPNGPAEEAIDSLCALLDPEAFPYMADANVARRVRALNGLMAKLCTASADDCRDLRVAAEGVRATLGAPTPLDRAVAEVCALLPREYPEDPHGLPVLRARRKLDAALADLGEGDVLGARVSIADAAADLLAGMLACDADATKEPG